MRELLYVLLGMGLHNYMCMSKLIELATKKPKFLYVNYINLNFKNIYILTFYCRLVIDNSRGMENLT